MRAASAIVMLFVVLTTTGCVTCHCQPVVNGDCTCVPAPDAKK